jgi:hypothetical protein
MHIDLIDGIFEQIVVKPATSIRNIEAESHVLGSSCWREDIISALSDVLRSNGLTFLELSAGKRVVMMLGFFHPYLYKLNFSLNGFYAVTRRL